MSKHSKLDNIESDIALARLQLQRREDEIPHDQIYVDLVRAHAELGRLIDEYEHCLDD